MKAKCLRPLFVPFRPVVVDHEEAVQQMESQGRHGEEVQRDDGFAVAFHEIYLPNGPAARFGPLYEKPT